jgi:hypothetical protein
MKGTKRGSKRKLEDIEELKYINYDFLMKKFCEEAMTRAKPLTFLFADEESISTKLFWPFHDLDNSPIKRYYEFAEAEGKDAVCNFPTECGFQKETLEHLMSFMETGKIPKSIPYCYDSLAESKKRVKPIFTMLRLADYLGLDQIKSDIAYMEHGNCFSIPKWAICSTVYVLAYNEYGLEKDVLYTKSIETMASHCHDRKIRGIIEKHKKMFSENGVYEELWNAIHIK